MAARRIPILVHLAGAALASALVAYWLLRLLAPAPPVVPVAAAPAAFRDPDAGLAARMFGDLGSGPAASSLNIQVTGVFAAATDSSAVIAVDGRPSRAVLLGHDVVAGYRLVEVRPDGITLEHQGLRSNYAVPAPNLAKASSPVPLFSREGDTLTAPSQEVAAPNKSATESARSFGASSTPAPSLAQPAGAAPEEGGASGRNLRPRQNPPLPSPPAPAGGPPPAPGPAGG